MSLPMALPAFNPDFSTPADWAVMYRAIGLQVVPGLPPVEGTAWKRPAIPWKEFQQTLVPAATFERWYGWPSGEFVRRPNMGLVTGSASGNVFVLDFDTYKSDKAREWWESVISLHNFGRDLETVCQTTGGGGKQRLFRAPPGVNVPTNKTSLDVDVRGQAGFALLPSSMHTSGREYAWDDGFAPWEHDITDAPAWLLDEVGRLVQNYGGASERVELAERTISPSATTDSFGALVDDREGYMTRLVWASVVDLWRECPIKPSDADMHARMREAYQVYERKVKSRVPGAGLLSARLEREGRGAGLFREKWARAVKKWDAEIARAGAEERVTPSEWDRREQADEDGDPVDAHQSAPLEYLDIAAIKALPDAKWMVRDLIIEDALGFIYGPPGHGKTFVALSLALHVAYGMLTWWWDKPIQRKGLVVYIAREGVAGLKDRIKAWQQANGVADDSASFVLIRAGLNFMSADDVGKLLATIDAAAADLEAEPAMIFVDTVSRVMPGADENLQKEMTLFVAACDALRDRFRATVVGVHHAGKSGDMRGSTVLKGAGDFVFKVEKHSADDPGAGILFEAEKIKDSTDGWRRTIDLQVAEWVEEGKIDGARKSLVAVPREDTEASQAKGTPTWPDKPTCRRVLDAIRDAWVGGLPWSSYPQAKRDGRYAPARIQSQFGVSAATAEDMIERWLSNDILAVEIADKRSGAKGLRVRGGID